MERGTPANPGVNTKRNKMMKKPATETALTIFMASQRLVKRHIPLYNPNKLKITILTTINTGSQTK